MKKYIYYLIIFLFLLFPINGEALVQPTEDFYVNDYANILSEETEKYILDKSIALNNCDGTQIVVVTVKDLDGLTIEEYAYRIFNYFGIGDKEKNNGLLLLLALEEREFRVEVGDGLGGILTDGKTGRFQDEYIIPYLKEDKWDEGIRNGYDAFFSEIVTQNNLNLDYTTPVAVTNDVYDYEYENGIFFLIFILSIVVAFVSTFVIKASKNVGRNTAIYLVISTGLFFTSDYLNEYVSIFVFLQLFFFLMIRFFSGGGHYIIRGGSYRGSRSYRSSGFGGRSSGGFSGGGGRSSGGGSSRKF